jgi:hypothetical protein
LNVTAVRRRGNQASVSQQNQLSSCPVSITFCILQAERVRLVQPFNDTARSFDTNATYQPFIEIHNDQLHPIFIINTKAFQWSQAFRSQYDV